MWFYCQSEHYVFLRPSCSSHVHYNCLVWFTAIQTAAEPAQLGSWDHGAPPARPDWQMRKRCCRSSLSGPSKRGCCVFTCVMLYWHHCCHVLYLASSLILPSCASINKRDNKRCLWNNCFVTETWNKFEYFHVFVWCFIHVFLFSPFMVLSFMTFRVNKVILTWECQIVLDV